MKKSFFKTAIFAMATAALIFAGCNSDSGGGNDYPEITNVIISGLPESAVSGPVELTADVDGNNLEGAGIEYSWEVAEGNDYASFENPKAKKSKLVPNCAAEEKEVKIKVTATLKGTENGKSSAVYTVKIAAKQESSGEGSGSGSGSGTGSTEGGTTGGSAGSGSGAEGGSTGGNTESGSTAEAGSVSAVVNADGSISCGKCGKIYNFTEQAKNCEHYKCATCGSVYYSQSEVDSCTSHVTVIFKDSDENGNESVTMVIKSGSTVIPPSWEKDGYKLTWESNVAGVTVDSAITSDVIFAAKWSKTVKATFIDSDGTNENVVVEIEAGSSAEGSAPSWTKDNFTLSWTPDFTEIEIDTEYTSVWNELPKCSVCGKHYATSEEAASCAKTVDCPAAETVTVSFVDNDNGNETVTAKIFKGTSAKSKTPAWRKEGYILSWAPDFAEIDTDTAYTAVWTEAASQWKGKLLLTASGTTTSDNGTVLTTNFKTDEKITLEDNGVKQVFNIAKSSSNMIVDANGLKFQAADTSLSFTTADIVKLTVVFSVSNNTRSIILEGPDGLMVTYLGKTSVTSDSANVTGTVSGNLGTAVMENAPAGDYKIYSAGKYTVYTQSITIE
ncbi:MAG: hypothetical protein MR385_04525 [Treponema berlinense]|nr:hypothetical protein [Treponema berlinense]